MSIDPFQQLKIATAIATLVTVAWCSIRTAGRLERTLNFLTVVAWLAVAWVAGQHV